MNDKGLPEYTVTRNDAVAKVHKITCMIESAPCIGIKCKFYINRPLYHKESTGSCRFYDADAIIVSHK